MPAKDTTTTTTDTPAAGDELAQGTPGEPASLAAGDLVHDEDSGRYGVVVDLDGDGVPDVLWLGVPARVEIPLRRVG